MGKCCNYHNFDCNSCTHTSFTCIGKTFFSLPKSNLATIIYTCRCLTVWLNWWYFCSARPGNVCWWGIISTKEITCCFGASYHWWFVVLFQTRNIRYSYSFWWYAYTWMAIYSIFCLSDACGIFRRNYWRCWRTGWWSIYCNVFCVCSYSVCTKSNWSFSFFNGYCRKPPCFFMV